MAANASTTPRYFSLIASEILPDNSILELVADRSHPGGVSLLRFAGDQASIERMVVYGNTAYFPFRLQRSLLRALCLPFGCSPNLNLGELMRDLAASASEFIALTGSSPELLAQAVFATWVPEIFPAPFSLAIWCPSAGEAAQILSWLRCVCRRTLLLADVSGRDLARVCDGLDPTLVFFRSHLNSRIGESISAYGWREICTLRAGKLFQSMGAKIFVTVDRPIDRTKLWPTIEIMVPQSRGSLAILDASTEDRIAQNFQPALLRGRLLRLSSKGDEGPRTTGAGSSVSSFVAGVASCFTAEPEVCKRQIALLVEAEKEMPGGSVEINQVLVELLLARCHQPGRQGIHLAEILVDLQDAFSAYGEELDASERLVGALLKALGFRTKPIDREGRGLKLDSKNRRRIHKLARGYRRRSAEQPFPGCTECVSTQVSEN